MAAAPNFTIFLHGALTWIAVLLELAGLIVCIVNLRLSASMVFPVMAFAGYVGAGLISGVLSVATGLGVLPGNTISGLYLLTHAINVAASAALVVGLYAVFRDIRDRFQYLRATHEEQSVTNLSREA